VRPAARPPRTTLKPGDTGVQVKVLQRALASLGYSAGAVDGQYGPATKQAVAATNTPAA
jgi:peptidoglycan hydrolase-like protein with peptidoglycan-binding domain